MSENREYSDEDKGRLASEISTLEERLVNSEGYRLYMKVRALGRSYYIFDRNHRALVVILHKLVESPEELMPMFAEGSQEGFFRLEANVAIALHNFLAGASTLVDHTRVFIGDLYSGSAFEVEYQEKKNKDLRDSSIVQFVQKLRNYALHRSIPVTTTKLSMNRVGVGGSQISVSGSITLKVDELRQWDGWNAKSRDYLNTLGEEVAITQVANEYREVIDGFYTWLNERQQELHSEAIKETSDIEGRLTQVQQEWEKAWRMDYSAEEEAH